MHSFQCASTHAPSQRVWLDNDTDLDPLRSHPRFVATVDNAKARFAD